MKRYISLCIGDISPNGSVKIIDQDRLCYVIQSSYQGAKGIRTISKKLLNEFVEYMETHNEVGANEAKDAFREKTDIDKLEDGDVPLLMQMAKMVLDKGVFSGMKIGNLQQIHYGVPGTGKSHIVKKYTEGESVVRATFHPDSDYSTFVGCYKPTSKKIAMRDVTGKVIVENGEAVTEDRIIYRFVGQAFLQAYIQAWKFYSEAIDGGDPQKQFLIIEEINRGNCAQVFGDLFQLLDRNDYGFSDYYIHADNDMKSHLKAAFKDLAINVSHKDMINAMYHHGNKDVVAMVLSGEILLLPNNLYIWATMNTSDQSLFPIDSAFKRRWDWKYRPIVKGRDDNGNELNWRITADTKEYDWWSFLGKINAIVGSITNSEDKKLGFFFCKAEDGVISADMFVGKVVFYLWNDVFKNFGFEDSVFKDDDGSILDFDKFYTTNVKGETIVRKEKVERFLMNLQVDECADEEDNNVVNVENGTYTKRHLKVIYPSGEVIENNNSTTTFIKVINDIGPERVAGLDMRISGHPMVSKDRLNHNDGGYGDSQRELNDGYWLITKLGTGPKLNMLEKISKALDCNLQIQIVEL